MIALFAQKQRLAWEKEASSPCYQAKVAEKKALNRKKVRKVFGKPKNHSTFALA
ncbi:hypothetical protein [Alloprevotella tannerae]|uniref:hypothetical protein n=1 Tax=Alloprevotella tannerae TaxID=76122 RepID=UPI0025F90A99|nr:hypothetical protein [Alloprevotella tannerae]